VTEANSGVVAVYSSQYAFAALKTDGSVVVWGISDYGGTAPSSVTEANSGVVAVYSTSGAFAALKTDGSVVAWGYSDYDGGTAPSSVTSANSGVVAVYSSQSAFAALKSNGSVVAWGYYVYGGFSSAWTSLVSGVVAVYSTQSASAALKSDGSVVAWGHWDEGGGTPDNVGSGVVSIYSTDTAFAALKTTATTFDLSAAHYRDMDRYDILRKKENRRRVNLTTLNNNVFTLSAAPDVQRFNPTIPAGKTFTIIVPDYTASSYSITSTATIPSTPGNYIIACDEGEPVTISGTGTTYVNYGSYVYKRETDNTYTKTTSVTINSTLYTLYGGDGVNSSGIALISSSGGGGGGSGGDSGGDSITDKLNNIKIYGSGMYDVLSGLFVLK
jgi:alpha-tubulin suppressor-like RCC1 family protein